MAKADKSWQAPPFSETPQNRQGWVEEACIQEGESWLKGQTAYQDIPKALDIISGKLDVNANQTRSQLNINHAKYILRKVIAVLSDVRPGGLYTSDAKFYLPRANMMNRVTEAIALESMFPRKLRMSLQYMGIGGSSYIWPRYTKSSAGYGEGVTEFVPLGLLDVLPVQLPADNNLQGAYTVTIIEFVPVWQAHGKHPAFQSELLPIARRKYTSTISARRMDLAERFKYGEPSGNWDNLYCEIRHTFIHDLSVNETGMAIPMGEWDVDPSNGQPTRPATSWSYMVPYLGQEIPGGTGTDGKRKMRKAEIEDCLLYPNMRLISTSRGMKGPLRDGPAGDWHGMVPLAKYCVDDWPQEPSGFSLVHDIYSTERARQTLERLADQIANARLDPTILYDRTMGMNDVTAETIDVFEKAKRIGVDGDPHKIFATAAGDDMLNLPAFAMELIKYYRESEDNALGLNEISALSEFKASLQSGDVMDKVLNLVGPLVKDISAGMEASTVDIWKMMKFMVLQYYTTARVMQYVGPDGLTEETFDFDPASLVPSHGEDEARFEGEKFVVPNDSQYTPMERAKMFAKNLRLITIPHRMHEITAQQEQLKWLQIGRQNYPPVAPHDVAKKLNIENYGEIDGDTVFERAMNWELIKLEMAARAQKLASALMPQGAMEPGGGSNQPSKGGRPPSGKKPPQVKQKSGASGPRTTVSES